MRCALLHGFAGTPAAWDEVIDAWQLAEPPVAFALPGHGGGPVLPTWDENISAIARVVDHFDAVVGYSLGARVALGLVAGGLVAHGVLIGVNPGIQDAERAARREFDAAWARMLRTEGVAAFHDAWTAQPLFATQKRVAPDELAVRRARRLSLDAEQLAQSLEVMGLAGMPDYWPAVSAHRDRIALLAGADDAKYVALSASLPCAYFEQIPNSGHDPTLENPGELAAAIARAVEKLR
ncbi:MAG TPA: alpha/beta fold hydrolase [Kofleriaceae bacterium]|nr:alpha/beta fold hydrolase [Kofleriaceae bacterium]